jgi:hypothetical protein
LVWLALLVACGDNLRAAKDAGADATDAATCDPSACPADACHRATCVDNACATIDLARCATPACSSACGQDSDGDGLADAWETPDANGNRYIDLDCNGRFDGPDVDILLTDADPARPDIFVRYDYMADASHTHKPPQAALDQVTAAFAAHGIALHWIAPITSIAEHQVTTRDPRPTAACAGADVVTMQMLRANAFAPIAARLGAGVAHPAYHYVVFAHNAVMPDTGISANCPVDPECAAYPDPLASGNSDVFGDDVIVAFGADIDQGFAVGIERFAGTTMHELGHNLGLKHGSLAEPTQTCLTFKPNYVSVMDYSYQNGIKIAGAPGSTTAMPCATDADCHTGVCAQPGACHCTDDLGANNVCYRIDYASTKLLDLNETSLDESLGVGGASTSQDIIYFFANSAGHFGAGTGPIDWNANGTIEASVQVDLDNDNGTPNALIYTTTDWDKLKLAFQCSPLWGAGP